MVSAEIESIEEGVDIQMTKHITSLGSKKGTMQNINERDKCLSLSNEQMMSVDERKYQQMSQSEFQELVHWARVFIPNLFVCFVFEKENKRSG